MQLFDTMTLDGLRRTQDGYLVADARVARTGIQLYTGREVDPENKHGLRDKAVVRVCRPEEEVFAKDAMHSYAYRPVTDDHPSEQVTAENWKQHSVGQTGGEVARDGEFDRVPLVLMDKAIIAKVEGGKRELSMGYSTELKFQDGVTPSGEQYDAIQTRLKMNHLAVASAARGGSHLKIGDTSKEKDMTLKTVTVDGIPVEVTDQGATVIATLQTRLADAGKKLVDAETVTCHCEFPPQWIRVRPIKGRTHEEAEIYGRADYCGAERAGGWREGGRPLPQARYFRGNVL